MPHLIDGVIDGRIFGDIGVGLGQIRLRLVVIVITHKVFDGVVREKLSEFLVELTGQCLVVDQHQRRLLNAGDQVGHHKRLARPGHPQQDLLLGPRAHPGGEFFNRLGLIPPGRELGFQSERRHGFFRRSS